MSLYMQNMHGKRVQELLSEIQCLEKYRFKFYQQAQILEELRFENCFHGCNCKILQPLSACRQKETTTAWDSLTLYAKFTVLNRKLACQSFG